MNSAQRSWQQDLVRGTEAVLTWRKRRRLRKKEKQKQKNVVLDWVEAFVWAAFVVLLINQYLLQAYQIPSGSMRMTLIEGDRIFVNKLVYGPELLPGEFKLPGFGDPTRAEVVIFENPSYISRGPLFDILQRVIYMVTLSLVDIDRNAQGEPRAHFLIKRAVGVEGDRLRLREGNMEIRPEGASRWMTEAEFVERAGLAYAPRRLVPQDGYGAMALAAEANAYEDMGLAKTEQQTQAENEVSGMRVTDRYYLDYMRSRTLFEANPHTRRYAARTQFYVNGWYVPAGRIFPMGDNRDNSRDARSFGAVSERNVLGRAMFRYWPLDRLGAIR
jgi:signal peptidase I